MADPVRCRIASARVRAEKTEALIRLIHQLFNRRHLSYVATGGERAWLRAELVQSLRRQSEVYRAMSTPTDGPLPFGLGYFRVRDDELEPVSDAIPIDDAEALVRLLSEFLEPGARLYVGTGKAVEAWHISGVDAVERLNGTEHAS